MHSISSDQPITQIIIGKTVPNKPINSSKWKAVSNEKTNPEAIYTCHKCSKTSLIHPNYYVLGQEVCIRKGCYGMENVAKRMLELRGYAFKSVEESSSRKKKIEFTCNNGHDWHINFEGLRKGMCCKKCNDEASRTKKDSNEPMLPPNCQCKVSNIGFRSGKAWICPHYNHYVKFPDSSLEWDYALNSRVTPYNVSPCSNNKYWFRCKNESCNSAYEQTLNDRVQYHTRCPYCCPYKKKPCPGNCLATTHPKLCEELDTTYYYKPTDITAGSKIKLRWICKNHGEIFKWDASPAARITLSNGCPKCNTIWFEQKDGGHDHFVRVASEEHDNKYTYVEEYKGNTTKIKIWCPAPNHGIFKQTPEVHKAGRQCIKCSREETESKAMRELKAVLDIVAPHYDQEKKFPGMVYKHELRADIYIPQGGVNLVIESDGKQHFEWSNRWGGQTALNKSKLRDCIKDLYCVRNKINLVRIPYNIYVDIEYIKQILQLCLSGKQIYATYKEYYDEVSKFVDMSNLHVIIVPTPK